MRLGDYLLNCLRDRLTCRVSAFFFTISQTVLVLIVMSELFVGTCDAQNASSKNGPFSNPKSIWKTQSEHSPATSSPISSPPISGNAAAHAQRPLSLPMTSPSGSFRPGSSQPRSVLPAPYEQNSTSDKKWDSPVLQTSGVLKNPETITAGKINGSGNQSQSLNPKHATSVMQDAGDVRTPLPLRRPGEKSSQKLTDAEKGKRKLGSTSQQLGTTTLVLGGIIFVILISSRLMKKHTSLGVMGLSSEVLEVLGRKMLDQKHAIHYVHCGNRILILGTSIEGVRTLAEITDPVEIDRIRGECKPIPTENVIERSFGFLLSKSARESEPVNPEKQPRRREKKRSGTRRRKRDENQQPAPELADFGFTLDELREGRS